MRRKKNSHWNGRYFWIFEIKPFKCGISFYRMAQMSLNWIYMNHLLVVKRMLNWHFDYEWLTINFLQKRLKNDLEMQKRHGASLNHLKSNSQLIEIVLTIIRHWLKFLNLNFIKLNHFIGRHCLDLTNFRLHMRNNWQKYIF